MGIDIVSSYILVESASTESNDEFCTGVKGMILQATGRIPDWLEYSAGARFVRNDVQFREFACIAGSVSMHLIYYDGRNGSFERAIIYRSKNDDVPRVYEIRGGVQSEFSPDELRIV